MPDIIQHVRHNLDAAHRWLMFGVIVAGAGVMTQLFEVLGSPAWLPPLFGVLAVVFASLDLAFDLSNRARVHMMMKRKYFELLADTEENNKTLIQAEACLHRYSAEEESPYQTLLASSYNAAMEMVYGDGGDRYLIPQRDLMWQNIRRFDGKSYPIKRALPKPSTFSSEAKKTPS